MHVLECSFFSDDNDEGGEEKTIGGAEGTFNQADKRTSGPFVGVVIQRTTTTMTLSG